MKKLIPFIAVAAAAAALSFFVFSALSGDDPENQEGVITETLKSKILGEERELIIHLPRGYDTTTIFPTLYVLDGGSQDWHMANTLDVLTTAGYSPQMIVVGIPNMSAENREKNLTPPFMRRDNDNENSEFGEADKFLDFLKKEAIPFVESNYRASSVRLISGNSRGGLLAMYTLLYEPEMFQARFCFSSPFWRQDNILVSKVKDFLDSRDTLRTFIYMSAGEDETENIKHGLSEMTNVINMDAPVGLVLFSEFTPGAVHQNNALISASRCIAQWSAYYSKQKTAEEHSSGKFREIIPEK